MDKSFLGHSKWVSVCLLEHLVYGFNVEVGGDVLAHFSFGCPVHTDTDQKTGR